MPSQHSIEESIEAQRKALEYTRRASNPVRRTFRIGTEHVCRLRWQDLEPNDIDILWVDFELIPIFGVEGDGKEHFWLPGFWGPMSTTTDIEQAGVFASGFIKFDGCTQFDIHDNIHVDSEDDLETIFKAIKEARRVALVDVMHRSEYL